jgi:hypothetical protein
MVHLILRLVRLRHIRRAEQVYVDEFQFLVNNWTHLFTTILHSPLIEQICAQGKSEDPDLFGSSVIDFLECLLDCKKDITVNIDSGGWCYIKGQYKVDGACMYSSTLPPESLGLKPMTVGQQKQLHGWLGNFVRLSNNYYLWRLLRCKTFDIDFEDGTYELHSKFYGDNKFNIEIYGKLYDKVHLIFEVDLKCRKELAPVELLFELFKEESCEDNEDESAHGTHTAHDPGPDLELKLQIRQEENFRMIPGFDYKYLIQQIHTDS